MIDDIYELIEHIIPSIENTDPDDSELEQSLWENYEISIENFEQLINDLIPFCHIEKSPLTGKWYQGFGTDKFWIIRREIQEKV